MSVESTPFVEIENDIPMVIPRWRWSSCYGSSRVGGGRCEEMDLTFDSIDEWKEHREKYHPVSCSRQGCRILASYKRIRSPHSYCPEHTDESFDPDGAIYSWVRTNVNSIVETPKLPDDHPIEVALQGLES